MPEPDWAKMDYDPTEPPNIGSEIIGRGSQSRKSKTFLPDIQLATQLGLIPDAAYDVTDILRRLHEARGAYLIRKNRHGGLDGVELEELEEYTETVEVDRPDGSVETRLQPQVLSDREVWALYPAPTLYFKAHQEWVDHYASIKGFSIKSATGVDEDRLPSLRRDESSAGTDRRGRSQNTRWQ